MDEQKICEIGYINDEKLHALISIYNPDILNPSPDASFVQVCITVESAYQLRKELDDFLTQHVRTIN